MRKNRDLFKKIRDTNGGFHAKMSTIKERNGMNLTEADDIKKRRQEYIERGGVKMAEEQDGEITFSSTNSLKEQQNGEQSLQNNF